MAGSRHCSAQSKSPVSSLLSAIIAETTQASLGLTNLPYNIRIRTIS